MNGNVDVNGDVDIAVVCTEASPDSLPPAPVLDLLPSLGAAGSEVANPAGAPDPGPRGQSDRGEPPAARGSPAPCREDEREAREARLAAALDLDSTVDLAEHLTAITSELVRAAGRPQPYPFYAR